ncbi:ATP-dependent RNA helicase Ucp1 [Schizosaccharomyces japonicus yFS275]|uniref:ATP-dependent RNA helicase Ucp1 n=1 Tax=Schizosaccharomyces japonicus (strain yFS275 / FY16936) TaxID=402676 RepID=B6K4H2_SCHJY|nr:ATP-dependent RNA helicase Ucp1 [Schizosaccharomyces japonicus yFS275]EEB08379.1 ATP-dependent RNA helicase Ucp1 [Schizosaccharomyces japonicus yFS275]
MAPKSKSKKQNEKTAKNVKEDAKNNGKSDVGRKGGKKYLEQQNTLPNRPTAKQVVAGSSWTGKIPAVLLNEYCQRQKWDKSDIYVKPNKEGKFIVISITLSRRVSKSSMASEKVTLLPERNLIASETLPAKDTPLEARNVGAVYALHRILSHKSMQHVFPPEHRKIWADLQDKKKLDLEKNRQWLYMEDPFKAQKLHMEEEQKNKEKVAKARAAAEALRKDNFISKTILQNVGSDNKFDFRHPLSLSMNASNRLTLQNLLQGFDIWDYENPKSMSEEEKQSIVSSLVQAGFRKAHAEESCSYTSSFEDALCWLLIHVPEDDLPSRFLPEVDSSVSFQLHDSTELAFHYSAKRMSATGYNYDLCLATLKECNGDIFIAFEVLQQQLLGLDINPAACERSGDTIEWDNEIDALKCTLGPKEIQLTKENDCEFTIIPPKSVHPNPVKITLIKPARSYPQHMFSIEVSSSSKLASYIKLNIIKKTASFANMYLNEPMLFATYEYLKENIKDLIENAGSLLEVANVVVGTKTEEMEVLQKAIKRRPKAIRKRARNENLAASAIKKRRDILADSSMKPIMDLRQTLPAWKLKDRVIQLFSEKNVVIVSGETGSGKSTQVAQFILDHELEIGNGDIVKIVCTQPRRISAISLADRVAYERGVKVGGEVGYSVRGESKQGKDTMLEFCTTGLLLRRVQMMGYASVNNLTCIIIDEVHERSVENDLLLALLRVILSKNPKLKVILMSATADTNLFLNYFPGAGLLHIEGRTFPVTDYYLEDISANEADSSDTNASSLESTSKKQKDKHRFTIKYELIASLVSDIDKQLGEDNGSILIFLPGVYEINRCMQQIENYSPNHFTVLPLHASLSSAEQHKAFQTYKKRKIVCSTNVAETSITINDIVAVVDSGRVKQIDYNADSDMVIFRETWASQAACKQRRGRAGRVRSGLCYKLYTRNFENQHMEKQVTPDILRIPLEQVCLSALSILQAFGSKSKVNSLENVKKFMRSLISSPSERKVNLAMDRLNETGAVSDEGELTGLGNYLAALPVDIKCGKLMVYAAMFGFLDVALVIAAILSVKSPFLHFDDRAREKRAQYGNGWGDLISDTYAYCQWEQSTAQLSRRETFQWADERGLSLTTLQTIQSTLSDLRESAKELRLYQFSESKGCRWDAHDDMSLLSTIIAAALSPNLAKCVYPNKKFIASTYGALEKEHEAKEIRYYDPNDARVFIHPGSTLFSATPNPSKCAFIAYEKKIETSKVFLSSCTPVSMLGMILLGSKSVDVDPLGRGMVLNKRIPIKAYPKLVILLKFLRTYIDIMIQSMIEHSFRHHFADKVLHCIRVLVSS